MAPDRLLRCCVMKHLKGWSFRDLERELRSNLVYRRFTHFDAEVTPDFTVFSRSFALLSPAVTAEIHQRVVSLACEHGVAQGNKLRTDSTVVESNVHYPTEARFWATASAYSTAACNASPANVRTEPWKWSITHAR
jgi:IS5 family transposase